MMLLLPTSYARRCFVRTVLCVVPLLARSAQAAAVADYEERGEQEHDDDDESCLLVVTMALLFAYCISLFGSILGYVSFLDDCILKKYYREGFEVRADVRSAEFVRRRGTRMGSGCAEKGEREYCATIEYNQIISDSYRIRVRKQIKALESDFVDPCIEAPLLVSCQSNGNDLEFAQPKQEPQPSKPGKVKKPKILSKQRSSLPVQNFEQKKLDVFVLNDKPLSGFPKKLLERRLGLKYRLSSVCTMFSTLGLAAFCIYIASQAVGDAQNKHEEKAARIVIWVFGMLIALQIPCVHMILNSTLMEALQEEYFESADLTPPGQEESSLSSGSGSFFSRSLGSLPSLYR